MPCNLSTQSLCSSRHLARRLARPSTSTAEMAFCSRHVTDASVHDILVRRLHRMLAVTVRGSLNGYSAAAYACGQRGTPACTPDFTDLEARALSRRQCSDCWISRRVSYLSAQCSVDGGKGDRFRNEYYVRLPGLRIRNSKFELLQQRCGSNSLWWASRWPRTLRLHLVIQFAEKSDYASRTNHKIFDMTSDLENQRVIAWLRVRGSATHAGDCAVPVFVDSDASTIRIGAQNKPIRFDRVFDAAANQVGTIQKYDNAVLDMLRCCRVAHNCDQRPQSWPTATCSCTCANLNFNEFAYRGLYSGGL